MDWVGPGAGVVTVDQSAPQQNTSTTSETTIRLILLARYAPAKTLPMAEYANITLVRDGAVARLTLNRPDRRNALTHAMMLELEDAFAKVRADRDCRVLVMRG